MGKNKKLHSLLSDDALVQSKDVQLEGGEIGDLYYNFDPKDSIAAALFSQKTCNSIAWLRHHRVIQTLYVLYLVAFMFDSQFEILLDQHWTPQFAVFVSVCQWFIALPFQTAWLLSCNKYAFKMVMETFDFWIKVSQTVALFTGSTSSRNSMSFRFPG